MEMKDARNGQDPNSATGNPPAINPGPGYSAQGSMNNPAPGYPPLTMQGPYGYVQPQPRGPQGQPNYNLYAGGPPVQNQPMGAGVPPPAAWMPPPPAEPNCPPGLEYLAQIDQLLIHQQVELLEVLIGFETNNKYEIKNSMGQRVYFAAEQTDCCTRWWYGAARPFTIAIVDNAGHEVIRLTRPYRCCTCCVPCCTCCLPCCLQKLEVQAPPGNIVGYVKQNWYPCLPRFTVLNEKEEEVLKVHGPCRVCSCCSDVEFQLKSLDGDNVVGKICKQWTGFLREYFTDAENFGVQFPADLDVKMKAVVLGACFLIDFMFFEKSGKKCY